MRPKVKRRRFKHESQGDLQIVWNVIDSKTNTRMGQFFGLEGRLQAFRLMKKLNKDKRRNK